MIHIHCSALRLMPVTRHFYKHSCSQAGEIIVCSNKMPPAWATPCRGTKMQTRHRSRPSQPHSSCSLPPPRSGWSSDLPRLFSGLLHLLFFHLEIISSRSSQRQSFPVHRLSAETLLPREAFPGHSILNRPHPTTLHFLMTLPWNYLSACSLSVEFLV